jgi:octaprenyl-diphosphate synthase
MMKMKGPADSSHLQRIASREAAAVESAMREDLAEALSGSDPFLVEVIEYALFGGGKRIRPLLAVLAAGICGNSDPAVYRLASAFEYLHVATLVHDDVIDNAGKRRGRPSVGRQYGTAVAILAGDWLHARAMYLVGGYGGPEGLEIFCRSTTGMVDGEFLQLRHAGDCAVTEEQYFAVIHRKTALLIASTCEIGALFAGAGMRERTALARYGQKLGTAFQVIDDLLDYQGDAGSTGKRIGNDFGEGKVTLPLLRALAAAGAQEREKAAVLFTGDRGNKEAIVSVTAFIERHGGFDSARATAETLASEAVAALEIFNRSGDREWLSVLKDLAGYVLARKK